MRALILFLILTATTAVAQTKAERIWKFANDHLGEKVGDGNCDELIINAFKEACGCEVRKRVGINKFQYSFGVEVPRDSVQPGDIIQIIYYEKETGKYVDGHVGIVNTVSPDDLTILNQNSGVSNKKDSFVLMITYDEIVEMNPTYILKVTYYHPS